MIKEMEPKDLILLAGYRFTKECHCDGFHTFKYERSPHFELRHRIRLNVFKLYDRRSPITGWLPIDQLLLTLNQHHHDPILEVLLEKDNPKEV